MTKSHKHQQSALLQGLVSRAERKEPGLAKGAMVLAYGFEDEAQLDDAIQALVACDAIRIDIDGRYPSYRIFKKKMRALYPLNRPIFVSSGQPAAKQDRPASWRDALARQAGAGKVVTQEQQRLSVTPTAAQAPAAPMVERAQVASPPPAAPPLERQISAVEAALHLETEREQVAPFYICFQLPKDDFNWLVEDMEQSGQPVALSIYARDMLLAEMDRRRTPDGPRHKLSARVLRTAREEGLDLDSFVTSLIEVGLTAREMNRRGI